MDYERNKLYFNPIPAQDTGGATIAIIVGVIMVGIGIVLAVDSGSMETASIILVAIGLLAVIFGCFSISSTNQFNKDRIIVTDGEIDNVVTFCMSEFTAQALDKLGLDDSQIKEAPPIEFWGYNFDSGGLEKVGEDEIRRSSNVAISGFYFSDKAIHYYCRDISLVSDVVSERTEEYFYNDVVSIKTDTVEEKYKDRVGKEKTYKYDCFMLCNAGNETLKCSFRNFHKTKETLNAMRNLLKEKKSGIDVIIELLKKSKAP